MKPVHLFLLLLFCGAMAPDGPVPGIGYASSQNGIGTYIYCVPDRPFDTVCTFSTNVGLNSYAGASIHNRVIGFERPIDALVRKAVRKEKKGPRKKRQDISAIVSFDGQTATAVRFTTQVKESQVYRSMAKQYRGYYIYIYNRPAGKYTVLSKQRITSEIDFEFTGYSHMHTMLDSLINRYEKNITDTNSKANANAVMTNNGIEAEFIQLN